MAAVGIPEEDASFRTGGGDMYLKGRGKGLEIGISLTRYDADAGYGPFGVYSWVWVKDIDLRKSLEFYVETQVATRFPLVHEFESSSTYIVAYLDFAAKAKAIDLLRDSLATLFECLFGSPDFSKSYGLSGPAGKIVSK